MTRPPAVQHWFQESPYEYDWEQDGLDFVKSLMPKAEPYRAWAIFSFTAASGRINECDLFIAVPGGLYLVELKGHPGHVVNNGETWSFREPGSHRTLTLRNPLHLTDRKTKELKGRLEWAANQLGVSEKIPRVEPAIFLSAPNLSSALDEVQQTRVYGRDDLASGLPWIWRDLLARPPQRESRPITPEFSRDVLPKLMAKIGIRASTAHLRFGDDWVMQPEPLDAGPTWEDRLAERTGIVREEGRVRIYLTAQQATEEAKRSVTRVAQREYQVLQGITHRGIAQAVQIREHQGGPAILFHHRHADLRLDAYLAVHGEELTPEIRLDLVRQLAEAVRYAHHRSLYHRALAARCVYVSARSDGSEPVLRIADWQAAARDFDTTTQPSIGGSSLTGGAPGRGHRRVPRPGVRHALRRPGRSRHLRPRRGRLPDPHGASTGNAAQRPDRPGDHRRWPAPARRGRRSHRCPGRADLPGHPVRHSGPAGLGGPVPRQPRSGRAGLTDARIEYAERRSAHRGARPAG